MTNSRTKGKVGEREAAGELVEVRVCASARRGVQYQGGVDSPDLHTSLPGVLFEVKRTEKLSLYAAMKQAKADAGPNVPVILHRRNRQETLAIVPLARLRELAERIVEHNNPNPGDAGERRT
jgi:uncharacterized protein (DUF2237 family)